MAHSSYFFSFDSPLFVAWLFFGLPLPASGAAGVAFGVSVLIAAFLSSAITTMKLITLFWTLSGEGIQRLLPSVALLFSGMIVPLPLFPGWLQPFLNIQPFRGIIDIPCRFYTGVIPLNEALYYIGFQLFWTLVFVLFGKLLLNKALKHFVVLGG